MKNKSIICEYEAIQALKNKDDRGIEYLFNKFYKQVINFTNQFLNDVAESEDVTADVFIALSTHSKKFDTVQDIQGFLYASAKNKCLNILKHRRVVNKVDKEILYLMQDEEFIESKIIKAELMESLISEIENLPPARKQIFKMLLDGMDVKEVATKLKISVDTVRVQKFRTINYLKKIYNELPFNTNV